jgi:secreted trypsin-like serine protease
MRLLRAGRVGAPGSLVGLMRTRHALAALAALALLGLCLAASATASSSPRAHASVIGGRSATNAEFPSLVYLEGESATGRYSCSGSVVAPRVVLTAGHCVEDIASGEITPAANIAVATGIDNLENIPPGNISRVSQAVVFPGFDPGKLTGDAGLLVLTAPTSAPPIPLAGAADAGLLAAGTKVTMVGWGLTKPRAREIPHQLQQGRTTMQSSKSCRKRTRQYYPDYSPSQQLCTLSVPKLKSGICSGDSGGPAIAARADGSAVQLGIASSVGPECSTALPNVYTRADKVASWVGQWIAAAESGGPQPEIKVPKVHAPFLSIGRTEEIAAAGFAHDFRRHFTHSQERVIRCHRRGKAKVKCDVSWYQGGDDYWGSVTIAYQVTREGIGISFVYTINWVNNHCYFYSGHRSSCKIHTKRR